MCFYSMYVKTPYTFFNEFMPSFSAFVIKISAKLTFHPYTKYVKLALTLILILITKARKRA